MYGCIVRVLVVGTGSVGRRHISNLLDMGVEVFSYSYRGELNSEMLKFKKKVISVSNLQEAFVGNLNAVVIANSTEKHLDIAIQAAKFNKHIFIEKPLSSNLKNVNKFIDLVNKQDLVVEAGFMLRCHPNVLFIREKLKSNDLGGVMYIRASVGQWLPDWRPGADYKQSYSASIKKGGGVIFDLIHELDLVYWLLGDVADVSAMKAKVIDLEIETEAIAQVNMRLESGVLAQVHMDYVRPIYSRNLEIVCRHGILIWDYVEGVVYLEVANKQSKILHKVSPSFQRNTMFKNHMAHFLGRIMNPLTLPISPLSEAVKVLKIALACHISSDKRRNIIPASLNSFC